MMDALTPKILVDDYVDKESYRNVHPVLLRLKANGLSPLSATMDGHLHVMRAFRDVWPQIKIQRCLYHILRQGLSWLRTFPKTQAAWELRTLLLRICQIHSFKDRDAFVNTYGQWLQKYLNFVKSLPPTSVAFKDLKRTVALINHALPDMFHYLEDQSIAPTTNKLENLFSRLKSDFQRHRGLSEQHKVAYLKWYCHYANRPK